MQGEFRSQLPARVVQLLEELEVYSGLEIRVEPHDRQVDLQDMDPNAMALDFSERHATILARPGHFQPQSTLHELLHLRRYWIDQVPMMVTSNFAPAGTAATAAMLDNSLEHLHIIPREGDYGEPWNALWHDEALSHRFGSYPWRDRPWSNDEWIRRRNCLMSFLAVEQPWSGAEVRALVHECVRAEGLLTDAQNFAARLTRDMQESKEAAISTTVRFLRIPPAQIGVRTFDVRGRRSAARPLNLNAGRR